MKKYIIILTSFLLAACEEFGPVMTVRPEAPEPAKIWTDEAFNAEFEECTLVDIQDIKDLYNDEPVTISGDVYIVLPSAIICK